MLCIALLVIASPFVADLVSPCSKIRGLSHRAGNEYQAAYQARLQAIEDGLNAYHDKYAAYPNSMQEWIAAEPAAAGLDDPIPHQASPFEIHLALLDRPHESQPVMIVQEPGFSDRCHPEIWRLGYGLFNTPRAFHAPYTDQDVARTKAALQE